MCMLFGTEEGTGEGNANKALEEARRMWQENKDEALANSVSVAEWNRQVRKNKKKSEGKKQVDKDRTRTGGSSASLILQS